MGSKVVLDWLGVKGHAGTLLLERVLGLEGFSDESGDGTATTIGLDNKVLLQQKTDSDYIESIFFLHSNSSYMGLIQDAFRCDWPNDMVPWLICP